MDFELDNAIKSFQNNNDLKVDGKINPFGETIGKVFDFIFGDSIDDAPLPNRKTIRALPFKWSGWIEVFAQLGVKGRNPDQNIRRVTVSFSLVNQSRTSFDYEIKGGDDFIRGVAAAGGASEIITITGNIATSILVRVKSHTSSQDIVVTVQ